MEKDYKPVKEKQKANQSLYSILNMYKLPKYGEREFLADIGYKENRINSQYLIQTWENRLIQKGIEDYVAVRGLVNCKAKEAQELIDHKTEQVKKSMLNLLPRYGLSQFLVYVDSLTNRKKQPKVQVLIV